MPPAARCLTLAGALLLAGCGLGNGGSPAEKEQRITKAELARMVLPRDELGSAAAGLRVEAEAGPVGNAEAAEGTLDPDDTAETLAGMGRVTGHELAYERPGLVSVKKPRGVLYAGTEVELLRDTIYAAKHLNKQLNDFQRLQGRRDIGIRLTRVSTFDVIGVGEEAEGIRATASFAGLRMHMTLVAFRRGRLVGIASMARADRRDVADVTRRLARRLDARIQGVLAGTIREGAEPADPAKPAKAAFPGRERLPALTLQASDLGPGVVVSEQGGKKEKGYVSHQRTFTDVRVGRSHLVVLRAETQLYRNRSAGTLAFRLMKTPDGRRLYARVAMKSFADESGFKPRKVVVRPLAGVGRDAAGLVVTFQLPTGKFRIASVFVRSGRHLQAVTAFCRAESFYPGDLVPLAERARRRLVAV
jgi:hypothetical protein